MHVEFFTLAGKKAQVYLKAHRQNIKDGDLKSIFHAIKHTNFKFIGHISDRIICKNGQLTKTYINKQIRLSIHQTRCFSKIMCQGEKMLAVTFLYKSVDVHASASAYFLCCFFEKICMNPWNDTIK